MDNMTIYNQVRSVPPEAQKPITAGRLNGMTDINPMWRIKRLTEVFGPCGIGWWYEITDQRIVEEAESKQKAAFVNIKLFYIDPESGAASNAIPGTGGASFLAQEKKGAYMSDECFKMALTDAISVAAKALGVGADIYYEKDRDKYTDGDEQKPEYICEDCGKPVRDFETRDGKRYRASDIAQRNKKLFGKILCTECSAKRREQQRDEERG